MSAHFAQTEGGEFNSGDFKAYCQKGNIMHYTTAPYSPQQNRFIERGG